MNNLLFFLLLSGWFHRRNLDYLQYRHRYHHLVVLLLVELPLQEFLVVLFHLEHLVVLLLQLLADIVVPLVHLSLLFL